MEADLAKALTAAMAPYDKQALAAAIGALQLTPENMERYVCLHALAHACAAVPAEEGQPRATVNRVRAIANLSQLRQALAAFEDPFENSFSESFHVAGEPFTIINGPAEGFPYVLRHLINAVQSLPIALPVLTSDLRLRLVSILRLVDAVLRRAGIPAGVEGVHRSGPIALPDADQLARLRSAVVVAKHDLPTMGVALDALTDFIAIPGQEQLETCALSCAFAAPLLDFGDDLVLAMPSAVVEAAIQMLLTRAIGAGAGDALSHAFHAAITADVRQSLERMRIVVMSLDPPQVIDGVMRTEGSIRIDDDKEVSLVIVTDMTVTYERGEDWKAPETAFAGGVMTLAVYQSFARPATLVSDYHEDRLVYAIQAVDLATIAVLEQGDPLAIWKYVRATAKLWETTVLYSPTALAGYYAYWVLSHGYYVSDEGPPSFLNADASGAAELRAQARQIEGEGRRATYAEIAVRDQPQLYNGRHLPLDLKRVDTPNALPPFRAVMDADQEIVMDELVRVIRDRLRLTPGVIVREEVTSVLNEAVMSLYEVLQREVAELASANLLENLLLRNEAVIRETIVHRAGLPARQGAFGSETAHAETAQREIQARLNATGALRFVIEYIVARPPAGSLPLTLERLDRLQSLTAQIIVIASLSDLLQFGLAEFDLRVLRSGRLSFSAAPLRGIGAGYMGAFATTEIARVARAISAPQAAELSDAFLGDVLEAAVAAEFGVSLATLRRFFVALVDVATAAGDSWLAVLTRAELLVALLGHGLAVDDTERLIDRFSIGPRADYLRAPGAQLHDIYPWRVERQLSHRRRPLLLRGEAGTSQHVLFAGRHVLATWRDLVDQLVVGTFPGTSKALKTAKGKITERTGRAFNTTVASFLRQVPGVMVEQEVKKVKSNGRTLHPPGDFDVLVVVPARRRLIALECKDISPARDVHAQMWEFRELITGDPDRPDRKPFVQKQRERIAWLEQHVPDVLAHFRLPAEGRWSVEGAIITNQVVPTPFLQKAPLPILSFEELRRLVDDLGAALTVTRRRKK